MADLPDGLAEFVDGAHGHSAQMRLEFGEGHFDGIEVGAVGRQKQQPSASLADGLFGGRAFVAGRLSRMTLSPSCSVGTSWVRTSVSKIARSIGASMTHGAVRAP